MRRCLFLLLACAALASAQERKLRFIAFGAHPDDADIQFSGTAALLVKMGHAVKFVAMTNGDAGHPTMKAADLAKRRAAETQEVARRLGISYDILPNHDGKLMPTLEAREQIIRKIREWNADVVLGHRPNDYHPDHRYTGVLMQDAAYMVQVPAIVPDVKPLAKNPVFLYFQDRFQLPSPFRPDIAVAIDEVWDAKINALDAMPSQFYEYQPAIAGITGQVPKSPEDRRRWLAERRKREITPAIRTSLVKWYGPERATRTVHYEAFEICEYGTQPTEVQIRQLFPMLRKAE